MFGLGSLATKIIAALAVVLLLVGLLYVRSCEQRRSAATQHKVDQSQAGAASNSARDAIQTQGRVNTNEQASRDMDRQNEKDIRDAEGSNQSVAGPANAAGRASLCRRAAYRNRPECRVFFAPSR